MSSVVDTRRLQLLKTGDPGAGPVLYVVARDVRVQDNWALLHALNLANSRQVPLLVLFAVAPMFNNGSARHNEWMVQGLQELARSLSTYHIPFFVACGPWVATVTEFVERYTVGEVVLDFNPLQPVRDWREGLAQALAVPVTVVDAHNIVPCAVASPKAEFAAYTLRPKIHRVLGEYLRPFPAMSAPTVPYLAAVPPIDWEFVRAFRNCDYTEPVPMLLQPGEAAAHTQLDYFIDTVLPHYDTKRNDPTVRGTSDLSPYIRFGHISTQRIALSVEASTASRQAKDAFLEELIVRRELAENYCYYTKEYAKVTSVHAWAQTTLAAHAADARSHVYTLAEFRDAKTHDPLWNAAQVQMVQEGKMHGYMRMYWAKKILEWTPDVQTAIDIALELNDHFELDGRNPSGVVGIMWSMCGLHDRAWNERPVFGKIRYMNYAGCKRKFDVKAYEERYSSNNPTVQTLF
jgi:deoxyribodipyrimidine photo-lyase